MSPHGYLWLIVLTGVATYLTRFPPLLISRVLHITPRLRRGLNYIPIGVFAAMVAPSIFLHQQTLPVDWPFYGATGIAILVASLTRNPLWTMLSGVAAIAVFRWLTLN